jgi:hypothetical protein
MTVFVDPTKAVFIPHLQSRVRIGDCPTVSMADLDWTHV